MTDLPVRPRPNAPATAPAAADTPQPPLRQDKIASPVDDFGQISPESKTLADIERRTDAASAWRQALVEDSISAYRTFLQDHGESENAELAVTRLNSLLTLQADMVQAERAFWARIKDATDEDAFETFLKVHPDGQYARLAQSKLAGIQATRDLAYNRQNQEDVRWATAKEAKDPQILARFMDDFPDGRFAAEASARMGHLQKAALVQGIEFGRFHALVIGNQSYEHLPTLKTSVNDANAVARILEQDYGFSVTTLIDATRGDIIDALDVLAEQLTEQDNLLIYYAGHGWLDRNADRGYWLPVDSKPDRRRRWLSNSTVTDSLKLIQAKHVMIIADSCFSGTLTRGLPAAIEAPDRPQAGYIRQVAERRARVALVSGGLEPVSDGRGDHSPFARALLDALQSNDSVLDAATMFTRIKRKVLLEADQTPQFSDVRSAGHDGGDFLFVRADLIGG